MKYLAPALHQGILVLEKLNESGPLSLEELSRITEFPKSTLLRILDTLSCHGWVSRNTENKQFESLVRVKFKENHSVFSEENIKNLLEVLSSESGCTAEWYVPREDGMEILIRSEPLHSQVIVKAKVGFVRKFDSEFDAVNRVAAKFQLHSKKESKRSVCFAKSGMVSVTSEEKVDLLNEMDKDVLTYDLNWNSNGVRRFAIGICNCKKMLQGILSLAECFTPQADAAISDKIAILKRMKFKLEASEKL